MRKSLDVWKRRRKIPSFRGSRRRVLLSDGQDDLSLSIGDVSSVINESNKYELEYEVPRNSSYSIPDFMSSSSSYSGDMKFQTDVISTLSGSVIDRNRTPLEAPGWVDSTERTNESKPALTDVLQLSRDRSPDWCPIHEEVDRMTCQALAHFADNAHDKAALRIRESPAPNFPLPREEVRIAIKHHHRLGRALSQLALNKEINNMRLSHGKFPSHVDCRKQNEEMARSTVPSTSSTCASTLDSTLIGSNSQDSSLNSKIFSESSNHLSFLNRNPTLMREHCDGQSTTTTWQTTTVENDEHSFQTERTSICDRIPSPINQCLDPETTTCKRTFKRQSVGTYSCCSTVSSRSRLSRRKIERHMTFLEAHMEKHCSLEACAEESNFWPCDTIDCSDHLTAGKDSVSIDRLSKEELFFPRECDLKSPPRRDASAMANSMKLTSPPNTPSSCVSQPTKSIELTYSQSPLSDEPSLNHRRDDLAGENLEKPAITIDGNSLVNNMERIKEETAAMMIEMQQKIKSDLNNMMEKETERHCCKIKSALSEATKHYQRFQNKENEKPLSSPQSPSRKRAQSMSPRSKLSPAYSKGSPHSRSHQSQTDQISLLKKLENSLTAMENNILSTISKQMEKEASHQRQLIEDIIEEKVTRVICGTNLEMQLAIQEVKRENERLSRKVLSRMSISGGSDFTSPVRFLTPKRADSCRRRSPGNFPPRTGIEELAENGLEDSFAQTMKVIDDFVLDCDDIVNDLDRIAFRMQDDNDD
ncbi:hypothetical protein ACHAXS_008005 [Conticribra weissflogii]